MLFFLFFFFKKKTTLFSTILYPNLQVRIRALVGFFSSLKDSCYENCSAGGAGAFLGGEFEPKRLQMLLQVSVLSRSVLKK